MTALELITSSLVMTGALAQGETPNNNDAQDAFVRLNRMVSGWANQRLTIFVTQRNVYSLVANQGTYTIGPSGNFNQSRPIWISYAGLILTTPSPDVEIPLTIYTIKDYWLNAVKDLTSTLPTALYYNPTFPSSGVTVGMGQIIFWPIPTEVNQVALYTPIQLAEFAALSTDYSLPPGYEDALEYNLAVRLIQAGMGLRANLADIHPMARETLSIVKRANITPVTASIDPALWAARPGWNWRTGQ